MTEWRAVLELSKPSSRNLRIKIYYRPPAVDQLTQSLRLIAMLRTPKGFLLFCHRDWRACRLLRRYRPKCVDIAVGVARPGAFHGFASWLRCPFIRVAHELRWCSWWGLAGPISGSMGTETPGYRHWNTLVPVISLMALEQLLRPGANC